jgi:hypothetical protein
MQNPRSFRVFEGTEKETPGDMRISKRNAMDQDGEVIESSREKSLNVLDKLD